MGSLDRRMWAGCSSGLTGAVIRDDLIRTTLASVHDRYQSTTKAESIRLAVVPNDICSPTSDALDVACCVKVQSGHGSSADRCCGRVERGGSFLGKPFHFSSEESSDILGSDSVNLRHDKSGQIDHVSHCVLGQNLSYSPSIRQLTKFKTCILRQKFVDAFMDKRHFVV